jgi:hypothetical protein
MEQKLRFEPGLGQLAILKKKIGADYEHLLRVVVSCFHGQKKLNNEFQIGQETFNTPIQENSIYKKQGPSPISLFRATRIFSKAKTLKKN